ncbi:hypothetical protein JB92DRAFT_1265987 [Gautieria morchelliformis]|nr:hypothetical protein JB92DRAFT_1265987 [Gautieria morchelliformis]
MECHSMIHGHVKDKVAIKAAVYYGFHHGTDDLTIQANKTLAEVLLKDNGYMYQSTGIYTHPILQEVIKEQWFDSKNADGIKYSASFHPIPDTCIALVFTVVEFVVHRWASGRHVKGGAFAKASFDEVYTCHLSGLEAWRSFCWVHLCSCTKIKHNMFNLLCGVSNCFSHCSCTMHPLLCLFSKFSSHSLSLHSILVFLFSQAAAPSGV